MNVTATIRQARSVPWIKADRHTACRQRIGNPHMAIPAVTKCPSQANAQTQLASSRPSAVAAVGITPAIVQANSQVKEPPTTPWMASRIIEAAKGDWFMWANRSASGAPDPLDND